MTEKATISKENQWFRENERDLLERARRERDKRLEAYRAENEKVEREKLRQAHWLKCPKCGNDLEPEHLEEVEVDRCTVCGGIFFDHDEIEKLLLRKTESRFTFYRRLFGLD